MIEVVDLHKYFGSYAKRVNTNIKKQEVVCVIGASGSGKSTFYA